MFVCVFGFRWCGQRQISTMVDNKDVLYCIDLRYYLNRAGQVMR